MIDKALQYLCPPGNGVFTVHTAKDKKEQLHQKIYGTTDPEKVQKTWQESLRSIATSTQNIFLLGVTMDTGGGIQRGANWGPLFIRNQLDPSQFFDLGDVKTIPHLLHDKYLNEQTIKKCSRALYGGEQDLPVSALSIAEDFCESFYEFKPESKLLGLGGDHSVSYALVRPWIKHKINQQKKVAVIHFDAHTDLMAHRLGIDICFASWAYYTLDLLEKPSHLIQLGIRSSGQNKQHWESTLGVQQFWSSEIQTDTQKISKTVSDYLKAEQIEEVYISFDIDALDIRYASSTGTPEKDGLQPHQCIQIIQEIAETTKVTGADLMEVAPFVKSLSTDQVNPEPDTTLNSARIICEKLIEVMD